MWGEWHYLYTRICGTAHYPQFAPHVPMDHMDERMELLGAYFALRRKRKRMTVDAFRKFLHKEDPDIRRRTRGGPAVDI